MNKKRSKKHHYLPVFYIKGFCNDDGKIYVFDKETKEIRYERPENVFSINNLNTTISKSGEKSDFIEDLYTDIDTLTAPLVEKVVKSKYDQIPLSVYEKFQLTLFVSTIYFRIPAHDKEVEEIRNNFKFGQPYLKIFSKTTNEEISDEKAKELIKDVSFQKAYRVALNLAPQIEIEDPTFINNIKYYYQDPGFHIISDNPIIYYNKPKINTMFEDFIMPLSCNRLLISSKKSLKNKEPTFAIDIDSILLHQAKRFIGFYRKDYLETLVNYYYINRKYWEKYDYLSEIFE